MAPNCHLLEFIMCIAVYSTSENISTGEGKNMNYFRHLRSMIIIKDFLFARFDVYPDANKASLEEKLVQCYATLNSILDGKESTPIMYVLEAATLQEGAQAIGLSYSIPEMASRNASRGISDALLFGSIAAALQDEILAPRILEQNNIMKYITSLSCRIW